MSIVDHVERYVALKRHLGNKYVQNERILLALARHVSARGEAVLRAERIVSWAGTASSPAQARRRLGVARRFVLWLRAEDDRHEVPHRDAVGRPREDRPPPRLPSDEEIGMLMEAALRLPPAGSITPHTLHCVIGLMAATGLRRAEVCNLRIDDVTADGLTVRETKFRKSRLVPLLPSTSEAVHRYLGIRKRLGGPGEHVFVLSTRRPLHPDVLSGMYIKLARRVGLRGGPEEPGPRLHDLRHRFAVRSLEQAVATDRGRVNRHILALSTYLGHVNVSSTYWYLQATPVLMRAIASDAEDMHRGARP